MDLVITLTKRQEGEYIVGLSGSLDSQTYTQLEDKLKAVLVSSTKVLIMNMSELSYISSMGISTLLRAKKSIEQPGGAFIMINLQPQIKLAFDIIKALGDMQVFQSIAEADAYLSAMERKEIEKHKKS